MKPFPAQAGPILHSQASVFPPALASKVEVAWRGHHTTHAAGDVISPTPPAMIFVREGWLSRSRAAPGGRRQIVEILLAGDHHLLSDDLHAGCAVVALSRCELARAPLPEVSAALEACAELRNLVAAAERRRRAILEERVVSLGVRPASERLAHLICEVLVRTGCTESPACELPMTQGEIADLLGLSVVHVNRTLRQLREAGLVSWRRGRLCVQDFNALTAVAAFSGDYLKRGGAAG